jgi:hypothetical protein
MSDSYLTVFSAMIAAMKSDATLTAIVGQRIYGDVPDNPTFPFVVLTGSSEAFDTKTSNGMIHTMQVSAFSREPSLQQAGRIRAAIYNIFHRQQAAFAASGVSGIIHTGVSPVLKESDGQTWNCPMQFRVMVD